MPSIGHQYSGGGNGWDGGNGRGDLLKNVDFDQLTNLVMTGLIETYRKYVEKS